MDIREFVFRAMHDDPEDLTELTEQKAEAIKSIRRSEIKNDPECRDICGRFLFEEIYVPSQPRGPILVYDPDRWEPLAEHFITTILPSNTFYMDAILFFKDITEGAI